MDLTSLPWWVLLIGSLGALLLLPRGVPLRPLGWPLLLILLAPPRERVEGLADIWQLDVGQGLAILIRTRHHTLLYDAGPVSAISIWGAGGVAGAAQAGGERIDLMLLSHADADHAGGALAVSRG
jgi:competence protein ComEC